MAVEGPASDGAPVFGWVPGCEGAIVAGGATAGAEGAGAIGAGAAGAAGVG
ncbi:flagellar biosynthesis protein FlgB, partial [Mesorhizobium sp. M7A.F.Ca.CA.004.05.1.1]